MLQKLPQCSKYCPISQKSLEKISNKISDSFEKRAIFGALGQNLEHRDYG